MTRGAGAGRVTPSDSGGDPCATSGGRLGTGGRWQPWEPAVTVSVFPCLVGGQRAAGQVGAVPCPTRARTATHTAALGPHRGLGDAGPVTQHGQWTMQENTLKDFSVSRSVPQKLEALYLQVKKRAQTSIPPPSAAPACSFPGHLVPDSPPPPGSPSLRGGPVYPHPPSPERDPLCSSPRLGPDA